ncbi:MAG: type II toxin-antitoxin system VapC family toxin [Maricaulaceae bacterium]
MTQTLVVHSGAALDWALAREPERLGPIFNDLATLRALAPDIYAYEIADGLLAGARSGGLTEAAQARMADAIFALPITVIALEPDAIRRRLAQTAHRLDIAVVDAAYLDLAEREQASLLALDPALREAAQDAGVPLAV